MTKDFLSQRAIPLQTIKYMYISSTVYLNILPTLFCSFLEEKKWCEFIL
jgi:hypothetical protein